MAVLACAICALLFAASAAAAPNWSDPADLSKPGRNATNPAVAMDPAGNTLAIWERQCSPLRDQPADGDTRPGRRIRGAGRFRAGSGSDTEPREAMTSSGEAVVVWKHFENPPGVYVILAATRPPGGSFGPPSTVYTAEAK